MGKRSDQRPEISVVIPHLNDAEGLARCLEALDAQAGAPAFEIIVVDNGSAEPPSALVERHARARLACEAEPGPGPARNAGVQLARSPLIAFIDSDCFAEPDWLATIARAFSAADAADVIGGEVRIALRDPKRGPDAIEAYECVYGYRQALYMRRHGYAATCNMAVRRSVFDAVGPFAGIGVAEDQDWGRRACDRGFRLTYLPEMRVATPARPSIKALQRKWDRHICHHFHVMNGTAARSRWALRAVALALSPPFEIPGIWRSPRLASARSRWQAMGVLTRIRLYRAARMLALALDTRDRPGGSGWRTAARR